MLVGSTLLMLLAANYKTVVSEYFLITLLPLIYIYLDRLIRDIDQPFKNHSSKGITGTADVNTYPLQEYRHRMKKSEKKHMIPASKAKGWVSPAKRS